MNDFLSFRETPDNLRNFQSLHLDNKKIATESYPGKQKKYGIRNTA